MYKVNDVYYSIQGEGYHTGLPVVVVRLQGCSLGCHWCDTPEAASQEDGQQFSASQVVLMARAAAGPVIRDILLTGGEPTEQDLTDLVGQLCIAGFRVHLETNGTDSGADFVIGSIHWLTISPKQGHSVLLSYLRRASELKFIVIDRTTLDWIDKQLPIFLDYAPDDVVVSLQPEGRGHHATELCIAKCKETGWRLSVQVHKYLQIA